MMKFSIEGSPFQKIWHVYEPNAFADGGRGKSVALR